MQNFSREESFLAYGKREVVYVARREDTPSGAALAGASGLACEKRRKKRKRKRLSKPKQATTVVLSEQEEQELLQITRRHQEVSLFRIDATRVRRGSNGLSLPRCSFSRRFEFVLT
jgi:hypothetical protein